MIDQEDRQTILALGAYTLIAIFGAILALIVLAVGAGLAFSAFKLAGGV